MTLKLTHIRSILVKFL